MRRFALPLLLILLGLTAATADVVHMRDGTVREGKIVSQNDDVVVLEMATGSTKAKITIPRGDVDRIEEKATAQDLLEAEYKKRLAATDRANADEVVALGKWCISKKLFAEAEGLYRKLAEQGGANFAKGHLALANMEYDRRRYEQAKSYLNAILAQNPKDLDAKLLLDQIADDEKRSVEKYLTDAIDLYSKGRLDAALDKLESFHDRASEEQAKAALAKVTFPDGVKYEDFTADVRLRVPCGLCKQGLKTCPACKGKANEDQGPCKTCAGAGSVVCDKCDGTGVKFGDVPDWEAAGVVRALEARATADAGEFTKAAQALSGNVTREQLMPLAARAEIFTLRALRWYEEIEALAAKHKDLTVRDVKADREGLQTQFREMCARVGQGFDRTGRDLWAKVEAGEAGTLAQDKFVRSVRDDLTRALYFYGKTHAREKDPYPSAVAGSVDSLGPLLAQVEKIIDRNGKVLKGFDLAMKNIQAKRYAPALAIFVEIVNNSSKFDLIYLSTLTSQRTNATLPEAMAACRFEVGKDDGKFGDTTEYERPAFLKKLLGEADAMAGQASAGYQNMTGYSAAGRRNSCPTGLVHNTRQQAETAKRWYRAALAVPYPLSADKRNQISGQIGEMINIISHCTHWYVGGPGTGGPGIGP